MGNLCLCGSTEVKKEADDRKGVQLIEFKHRQETIPADVEKLNDVKLDDRRSYIRICLNGCIDVSTLQDLILTYLGCWICDDGDATEYRHTFTMRYAEDSIDCLKSISNPNVEQRIYCRYCGLTRWHHIGNRERVAGWGRTYDLKDANYQPHQFYCEIRCPIHLCVLCEKPFV